MSDTTDIKALSYARLIEVRNILSGFEDGYDTVADKENYEAMRDAQALIDELISARWQLVTVTTRLEAERQRADGAMTERNTALKRASAARNGFDEQYQLREKAEAELAALKGEQVPVGYMHTLHMEAGQSEVVLSAGVLKSDPFGMRGKDYDNSYTVTTKPLFTAPQKPVGLPLRPTQAMIKAAQNELRWLCEPDSSEWDETGDEIVFLWIAMVAAIEAAGGIVKGGESATITCWSCKKTMTLAQHSSHYREFSEGRNP
ncbi:hypothetical protein A8A01_09250 [Ewingella americana]|nr:hypothetical protein A8A01_09250 [Ewingella americana]